MLILFLASFSFSLYAQTPIVKTIKKGLEFSYNFKWKQAESVFHGLIRKYPNDPRGYHYQSSIYLWYYLSNQDTKDLNTFVAYSDSAIEKAKNQLEDDPDNANTLYILGADYSYRALAFAKAEKFLDAVWASKKSESYLNKTLEIDSTYYDAYLGLGLYNFGVGQIPSTFSWALSLAGIHGDVKTGLKFIEIAAKEGNMSKVEAQYYLSQILTNYFNDNNSAEIYLKPLILRYPDNLLFDYSYAILKIKRRKLKEAEKILIPITKARDTVFKQLISFSNFLMGDVFFKQNMFEAAKPYYINFLNTTLEDDYKGIACYRLGVCFELLGDRDDAIKYFSLSDRGNMDLEDDIYAKRRGEVFSKRPLTKPEISLILDKHMLENGEYQTAADSLSGLVARTSTENIKAEAYLYLSDAAFWMKNYKRSLHYATTSKALNSTGEEWIKPFSCYYAARACGKLSEVKEMKKWIEEADGYSDYDYHKHLKNLLFALSTEE